MKDKFVKDLVNIKDLSNENIEYLFEVADQMLSILDEKKKIDHEKKVLREQKLSIEHEKLKLLEEKKALEVEKTYLQKKEAQADLASSLDVDDKKLKNVAMPEPWSKVTPKKINTGRRMDYF